MRTQTHLPARHPARRGPAFWLAAGFGSGLSPWAPGTAGSLLGGAIGAFLLSFSGIALAVGVIVAAAAGFWATPLATGLPMRASGKGMHDDPGWVVIDEVAGQMIAMLALPRPHLLGIVMAFGLFRLFDIAKPGPVGWLDRRGGALGIMADDLLAGTLACAVLLAVRVARPGLF